MDTAVELKILVLHSVTGREADIFATKNSVDTAAGLKNLALQEVSTHRADISCAIKIQRW
jgi:hypothetical protein